jgi:hypothetical protein
LSTIFPTVDMATAPPTGDNGGERRGSSLPDHMLVDDLGPRGPT